MVFPDLYLHNVDHPCQRKNADKINVRMQLTATFIVECYILVTVFTKLLHFPIFTLIWQNICWRCEKSKTNISLDCDVNRSSMVFVIYLGQVLIFNSMPVIYHMFSLLLYIENVWQVKSWLHKAVMLWFLGISVLFLSSPCFCDLLTAVVTSSSSGTICKHMDFSTWEGLWWWWCSGNIHRYRYKLLWIKKSLCAINLALPVDRDKYT